MVDRVKKEILDQDIAELKAQGGPRAFAALLVEAGMNKQFMKVVKAALDAKSHSVDEIYEGAAIAFVSMLATPYLAKEAVSAPIRERVAAVILLKLASEAFDDTAQQLSQAILSGVDING